MLTNPEEILYNVAEQCLCFPFFILTTIQLTYRDTSAEKFMEHHY